MLGAKVLPADAIVDSQAFGDFPRILKIQTGLLIAIAAFESGRADRQIDGAVGGLYAVDAGIFVLGIDGGSELVFLARRQVIQAVSNALTQDVVGFFVGAEGAVIAQVGL